MHVVRIPWRDSDNETNRWDTVCVWALEQFGLPGTKFTAHPTANYMDFNFYDKEDATVFALRWL